MSIESRLSEEQENQAQAFLAKLKPEDRANVERITSLLNELIGHYDNAYTHLDDRGAIFGAYGIGGWVNKEGKRLDVDLLVVTGVKWDRVGYVPIENESDQWFLAQSNGDELVRIFAEQFADSGFDVDLPRDIPNEYSQGAEPRLLIRLTPGPDNPASPIDLVYISGGYSDPPLDSFETFYNYDVGDNGNQLGRVALIETIVTKPAPKLRP